MFDNKTIGKRFADLRKTKKDKNGKDMPIRQLANELSNKYIKEYKADIIRQEIGKVENKDKFPQLFLIDGYSKYFHVTSDYLLGLRDTKPVDENIAMISKVTGLSNDAIETLKSLKNVYDFDKDMKIFNYIMSDIRLFSLFLSDLRNYIESGYNVPIHPVQDEKTKNIKYVENIDIESDSISVNTERCVYVGKENGQFNGEPLYDIMGIPISSLDSLSMLQIQEILRKWKKKYKGSDD